MPPGGLAEAESLALLDSQANDAIRLFNEKKYGEAEALSLKVLDLAPNHRLALRVLFEIRKAQQRHSAAEALGARLAALPGPARPRPAPRRIRSTRNIWWGRGGMRTRWPRPPRR
ncbi:hypothetical protein [Acidocella aromatica]|uniref:Tetratricopeptide repeat protein n=1 Tax=Acidocella aromatica TaxID=1303579 RepID=A0A840VBC5_9PROT|nr:hypothetical protein [Acidocella aromatica]MBB5373198.1 hypothetical protein [Acidocella aromatica]